MERNNNASVTFPVHHWKTNELVGRVTMDYGFKCYYEGVTIYMNDSGYPFIRSKNLVNRNVANIINSRSPSGAMGVHNLNYYIETGKWAEEGISALHHKNRNKMDASLKNLELVAWANGNNNEWHNGDKPLTREQMDRRDEDFKRRTGHDNPNNAHVSERPPARKVVSGENIPVCPLCGDTSRVIIVNRSYVCLDHPWSFENEALHG